MTWVIPLAVCMIAVVGGQKSDKEEVIGLAREMYKSKDPGRWWVENAGRVNSQLAATADELVTEFTLGKKIHNAQAMANFASIAHLRLGERLAALKSRLYYFQSGFLLANSP